VDLDFEVEPKQFTQPASDNYEGVDASVNIVFEPSTLGESRAMLIVSSPEGGEYSCMLYGKSTFPQPKGPFKFGAGAKPNPIQFKNPFFKKVDFDVRVDNPAFTVSAKSPLSLEVTTCLGNLFILTRRENRFPLVLLTKPMNSIHQQES